MAKFHIGVDLGGTNIAVGVVNDNNEIVGKGRTDTENDQPAEVIVKNTVRAIDLALADAGITYADADAVGIACPGTVVPETGVIAYANNLHFENVPLADMLSPFLHGLPCRIGNDANLAAYGELKAGAGQGAKDFVAVTLGTGVGGGIVIDGKIYTGFNAAAAELGHMIIVSGGTRCTCGISGCWEAYASATALIRQTREAMERHPSSKMWEIAPELSVVNGRTAFDAMRAGDEIASQVVDTYIGYVACGIINIINIFQPEFVCIGGGISNERETLLAPIREIVAKNDYNKILKQKTQIRRAELGNDAGIIGAALYSADAVC